MSSVTAGALLIVGSFVFALMPHEAWAQIAMSVNSVVATAIAITDEHMPVMGECAVCEVVLPAYKLTKHDCEALLCDECRRECMCAAPIRCEYGNYQGGN